MARHDQEDATRASSAPAATTNVGSVAPARRLGGGQASGGQGLGKDPVRIPDSVATAAAFAHDSFGNGLVASSLSGELLGGIGPMVAGDLTFALGGVGGSVDGDMSSNQVMGRAMRDFEAQDFESEDPSLRSLNVSGGAKLPEPIKARFERALGHDFDHVRVHRDGLAAQQSSALNAHAFTIESHIWFGSGEWAPGTPKGDRLLAHELTHVIQHDEGRIRPQATGGMQVSSPSDPLEREAYGTEARVLGDLQRADTETQDPAAAAAAPAMRKRATPAEPDTDLAERAVRTSAGGRLPAGVADRMSRTLGHDFSGVRVHTDSAADQAARALNARAFALGSELFFARGEYSPNSLSGQQLLAHELTHVVQHAEGRLPSATGDGLQVSSPSDAAEREASAVESAFSPAAGGAAAAGPSMGGAPSSTSTSTASGGGALASTAMRSAAAAESESTSDAGDSEVSEQTPDQVEFTVAGQTLTVELTEEGLTQTVEVHEEIVPGLILETGTITFDEDWNIVTGSISAQLTIGTLVEDVQVEIAVGEEGELSATIENVNIPMPGDLISGTMNLQITAEGVSGEATFTSEEIDVGEGFTLDEGELIVRIAAGGEAECEGTLSGKIAGTLDFTLTTHFTENRLAGNLETTLEEPIDLGYDISITGGSVGGELNRETGTTLSGGLDFDLAGWASAELTATVVIPGNGAEAEGAEPQQQGAPEIRQAPDQGASGPEESSPQGADAGGGDFAVVPVESAPDSGGGGESGTAESSESSESSESDDQAGGGGEGAALSFPTPGVWSLRGTVTQDRELVLGEDISVTGAQATIEVADGVLQPVGIPTATLSLPDNWQAVLSDGEYSVQDSEFQGEVEVSLTEPLDLGEGLVVVSVQATGTLEQNNLTTITGSLQATYQVEGVPNMTIAVEEFTYDVDSGEISCDGTVTIEEAYEVFNASGFALNLLPESSLTAEIRASNVEAITGDLKFTLKDGDNDFLSGDLTGRLPLSEDESLEGTLNLSLDEPQAFGEDLLITEASLSAQIEGESILVDSGTLVAYLETEDVPRFKITFEEITYDVTERDLGGFAVISLDEDVLIETDSPYDLYLAAGESDLRGTIEASELTLVEGTLGMMLREDGEDFIALQLEAEYPLTGEGSLSGTATATLAEEREIGTVGAHTLVLAEGTELSASLADDLVQNVSGELTVSVREGDEEWARAILNGTYVLGEEPTGFTGEARFELTEERELEQIGDYALVITAEEGGEASVTATFTENDITEIGGNLPFALNDQEGTAIFTGNLSGSFVLETEMFSGTGSLHTGTTLDIDVASGVVLRIGEGTGGTVTATDNQITQISGEITASILYDEEEQFEFTGEGDYDVQEGEVVEAVGRATLTRMIEPFGEGIIQVSNLEAQARIEQSDLVEVSGGADMLLPTLNNSSGSFDGTYRREGDEDRFSGQADIHLVVIPESDGRGAEGDIDFSFDGTGNFDAAGDLTYSLSEAVSGEIGVEMDQELDPLVSGTLELNSELVPAAELFRKEIDLLPTVEITFGVGPVPAVLRFGAGAGFGLGMDALVLTSEIGISGWRPLTEATTVPDFDASAELDWGLTFDALAAAWMSLSIGIPVLSAGGGLKGEALLEVPISAGADVNLHGRGDEFWGDMGVSLGIGGGLTFTLTPFLVANIFGGDFDHDFDGWEWALDDIIDLEWGKVYEFGDREGEREQSAADIDIGQPDQTETVHEDAPDFGGESSSAPARSEGGPDLSGVSELAGDSEAGGEQTELEQRMEQVQALAEGLEAIGYLIEQIGDLLMWAAVGGPFGLAIRLVYKMIIGEITWTRISTAVEAAIEGIRTAYDLIEPYLPDWWAKLQELVDRGVDLFDEWWNGDTRMHEAVQRGEHREAGREMKAEMVERMLDMWAQEDHKISVIQVLESGDASYVISQVGWDTIHGKMTNMLTSSRVERRFQQFCEQNGYGQWVTKTGFFGGEYREFEYSGA